MQTGALIHSAHGARLDLQADSVLGIFPVRLASSSKTAEVTCELPRGNPQSKRPDPVPHAALDHACRRSLLSATYRCCCTRVSQFGVEAFGEHVKATAYPQLGRAHNNDLLRLHDRARVPEMATTASALHSRGRFQQVVETLAGFQAELGWPPSTLPGRGEKTHL